MKVSDKERVLEGRLTVCVFQGQRRITGATRPYDGNLIEVESWAFDAGRGMVFTPLELAALLDGPLERALEKANGE